MKKLLAITLLVLSSPVVFARAGEPETWKGYVSDTHCGTHCQRNKMTPDRDCVHRCVKQGAKYALTSGTHVYVLEPQAEAAKFAAENVQVTGSLSNNAIHITSITPVEK
ncbi:MAG TPA: hypothetical protein VHB45_16815 [Alloacidobacterium sp.]|nr:hypothetical protein [Alloacidobacterium sp.]